MKPIALLDANVLLARVWRHHPDHVRAAAWLRTWAPRQWASCAFTQAALVRLSSNRTVIGRDVSVPLAYYLARRIFRHPHHCYLERSPSLDEAAARAIFRRLRHHRDVTDACLVLLAEMEDVQLVTFDRNLSTWASDPSRVIVIP